MVYLSVETLSIISYVLACYLKKDPFSTEAGLNISFRALSTGLMLYGISLIYGLFGTLDMPAIGSMLFFRHGAPSDTGPGRGACFRGVGVQSLYRAFSYVGRGCLRRRPVACGGILFGRAQGPGIRPSGQAVRRDPQWAGLAAGLAVLTMTVGNFSAFHQDSVKRLLAFSSIAQAGYILAGMAVGLLALKPLFFILSSMP